MSRRRAPRATEPTTYPSAPSAAPERSVSVAGDTPCPGPCNRDFRAAEEDHEPHVVPFHPGRPTWCRDVHAFNDRGEMLPHLEHDGCHERILKDLSRLPDLATNLAPGQLNTGRTGDTDQAVRFGGARALAHAPSLSPAWDTADLLIRWLVSLEDWTRVRTGHAPNRERYRTMSEAVTYLTRNGNALLAAPGAERLGQDIMRAHRRLEGLIGQDRLVHRLTEPCPHCARKGMRRNDGDELVRCVVCRAVWDWEHFQHLARTYAENERAHGRA